MTVSLRCSVFDIENNNAFNEFLFQILPTLSYLRETFNKRSIEENEI